MAALLSTEKVLCTCVVTALYVYRNGGDWSGTVAVWDRLLEQEQAIGKIIANVYCCDAACIALEHTQQANRALEVQTISMLCLLAHPMRGITLGHSCGTRRCNISNCDATSTQRAADLRYCVPHTGDLTMMQAKRCMHLVFRPA